MGQGGGRLNEGEPRTLTILLTKGPYVSEAADMAFKTALAARRKGYKVNVFLYLDGCWTSHITGDKDYNNPGEWLRSAIERGVTVNQCERCTEARDLGKEDMNEGIDVTGSFRFIDQVRASDRVITFGG
ncbi:MAG: DsrE family protein [Thermoplasmata archaeon]|nr:DsrE family protein [Thermoplasmata archaeon]